MGAPTTQRLAMLLRPDFRSAADFHCTLDYSEDRTGLRLLALESDSLFADCNDVGNAPPCGLSVRWAGGSGRRTDID